MKIDLTKAQYKTSMKIMYCGEWMLNSHKIKEDKLYKETDNLEQHIFSYAKDFGVENWFELSSDFVKYFPTQKMERELHKFVDKYDAKPKRFGELY